MATSTLVPGQLLESLKEVIDPEVGINIVDLGLVYAVELFNTTATVEKAVKNTLSTRHPELTEVEIRLVWQPRWNVEFITEEGRRQLRW